MKSKLLLKKIALKKELLPQPFLEDAAAIQSFLKNDEINNRKVAFDKYFSVGINQKDKKEVRFPLKALNKGLICLGSTGSGKTVFCKMLCEKALQNNIPVIAIDSQGDLASMAMDINNEDSNLVSEKKEAIDYLNNKVEKVIFTPQSTSGIPICANPFDADSGSKPYSDSMKNNLAVDQLATIVLYQLKGLPKNKLPFFQGALNKIIKHSLKEDKLTNLNDLVENMCNMPVQLKKAVEKILDENQFDLLKRSFQTLLNSSDRYFFDFGVPLNFDLLTGRTLNPENKTRLSIIYLNSILSQTSKEYFITIFLEKLYSWMLKNPIKEKGLPQLVLFIDEIGQYIPPQNHRKPSCKDILIKLKKQARKFGIAIIGASQSPGDFDYLALGQSNSTVIGRLKTPQDYKKVEQMVQGDFIEKSEMIFPFLKAGEFILAAPDVSAEPVRINTDYTLFNHRTLTEEEFEQVIPDELRTRLGSTPNESKKSKDAQEHPSLLKKELNQFSAVVDHSGTCFRGNNNITQNQDNNIDAANNGSEENVKKVKRKNMKIPSIISKKYLVPCGMVFFICLSIFFLSSQIGIIYGHFRNIFGPAFIGLLGLTILFVTSLFRIFFKKSDEKLPITSLVIVQYAGPTVGLLGTIISIQGGFGDLNLGSVELETAINQITTTLGISLSTTVYGMVISLCAMIVRLILDKQQESESV